MHLDSLPLAPAIVLLVVRHPAGYFCPLLADCVHPMQHLAVHKGIYNVQLYAM